MMVFCMVVWVMLVLMVVWISCEIGLMLLGCCSVFFRGSICDVGMCMLLNIIVLLVVVCWLKLD